MLRFRFRDVMNSAQRVLAVIFAVTNESPRFPFLSSARIETRRCQTAGLRRPQFPALYVAGVAGKHTVRTLVCSVAVC